MAAKVLLEISNKEVMSYQELKQITRVFDTDLSKEEKNRYIRKSKDKDSNLNSLQEKDGSLAFFFAFGATWFQ